MLAGSGVHEAKTRLDLGREVWAVLSWSCLSMSRGGMVSSPSHTCLGSFQSCPGRNLHSISHFISFHFKSTETIYSPASEELLGLGLPDGPFFLSSVLSTGLSPARSTRPPLCCGEPTTNTLSSPAKAPWEAFLTFRPASAQSWPHARDNHFLAGCLPSWAPWAQLGWWPHT